MSDDPEVEEVRKLTLKVIKEYGHIDPGHLASAALTIIAYTVYKNKGGCDQNPAILSAGVLGGLSLMGKRVFTDQVNLFKAMKEIDEALNTKH